MKGHNKKNAPVRPPAPVTSTVLFEVSAMATTLIPTLTFRPLWFLLVASDDSKENEEEE